ncbi:related to salicylate 1-monooxygenase [Lecanosticta acicola]|uniref:Related to salicylate 1-monooxygenase n=1 Tax=Lecanosticta acicola TaxID=111012 RepID=A0AAI9EBC9_9PEZI|nr:related to salicylate 1-monooxygenase [Lecanosticta acicola]
MSQKQHILISGAGIAGPTIAHFLSQTPHSSFHITIIERAPAPRPGGQSVDVRGHGLTVVQRMGLEDTIRSRATNEKGLRFVDSNDTVKAEFPVGEGEGFTGDIEILRGDLAGVLYDRTRGIGEIEYVFGERVSHLVEGNDGIHVEFENGLPGMRVDAVIAADGWASRTRKLAFGANVSKDAVKDLGQWAAWFTIPRSETDSRWARWYNAPGKRMMLLRPDNESVSRTSLWIMPPQDDKTMDHMAKASTPDQKAHWSQLFKDAGWEAQRVLRGLQAADDFYMQKIAQVKMPRWSSGRVALAGDAGYCPSPISGMGTTVALVGAYVLAGEIANHPNDLARAFEAYETRMRAFVATAQKLAPGAPSMANPQTQWGIWILYLFLGLVAWTGIMEKMGASFSPPAKAMELPEYEFGKKR